MLEDAGRDDSCSRAPARFRGRERGVVYPYPVSDMGPFSEACWAAGLRGGRVEHPTIWCVMSEHDFGELLEEYRPRNLFVVAVVVGAVLIGLAIFVSRSSYWVGVTAVIAVGVPVLKRRVRFAVHEKGIVVQNYLRLKSFSWDEITRFERSCVFGRRGVRGQVLVAGLQHEILALDDPSLDEKLIHLNDLLRLRGS